MFLNYVFLGMLLVAVSRVRHKDQIQLVNFVPTACTPPSDAVQQFLCAKSAAAKKNLSCCREVEVEVPQGEWFVEYVSKLVSY